MNLNHLIFKVIVFILLAQGLMANAPAGRYTDETGAVLTGGSMQVKDTVTGLIWQRTPSGSTYTWSAAATHCTGLSLGSAGIGSWRLPTIKELSTLVDVSIASGATIDPIAFPSMIASFFWSSTVYQPSSSHSWGVYFFRGDLNYYLTTDSDYAVCVR